MKWVTSNIVFDRQNKPGHAYFGRAYDFIKAWNDGQEAFVLQTSGSTGLPKPITVTRKQLTASARMTGRALNLNAGTRALVCLNISYIAGLMMLVRGMELGWELTIIEPAANPILNEELADFDFVALVPMQLAEILDNPLTTSKIEKLGKVLLGGAAVSISLQKRIEHLEVPVFQSYGMTETVSHIALKQLNGPHASAGYTFLPDIEYGTDERGCLFISGVVTNHALIQTNDIVAISGNQFEWIGRADNIINSGGVKIFLDQVDIRIAEVFYDLGVPNAFFSWHQTDEKWGQKLILVIEGEVSAFTQEQLTNEIRKQLSAYETPKGIYFVERFSKTPTDKVDKRLTIQQLF
ncbi:AMP-binding protein [Dyadobacter sp. CY323]|uniref:AMP-binding protein n=1 Tax=Dyadobacter sp. CY323 TaxID=2907302 RepID=UPI001F19FFDC|nr:AMP-binding protein [Dyadobacter sp. CY323]MCE6990041.1 AMP-binding protein [Dyadobacter sp. CY323]